MFTEATSLGDLTKSDARLQIAIVKSKASRQRSEDQNGTKVFQTPIQIKTGCSNYFTKPTAQICSKKKDYDCFAYFQRDQTQ